MKMPNGFWAFLSMSDSLQYGIEAGSVWRFNIIYNKGKKDQVVNVDYSVGIKNVKADIEFFRINGVEMDDTGTSDV